MERIYNYHPKTKELLGDGFADPCPLNPDGFLVPAYATTIEPPDVKANEKQVFDEKKQKWSIVPDFRGQIYYNTSTKEAVRIEGLGIKPDLKILTEITPPSSEHYWDSKKNAWVPDIPKIKNIKIARAYQITKGYVQSDDPLRMPPQRDANWRDFVRIVDKKKSGQKLTPLETSFIEAMIDWDKAETEDSVYALCASGLVWQMQCWKIYEQKVKDIQSAGDPLLIDETAMAFPSWIEY